MSETVVVGLLTFLLGLVLGHRLTLWREKRKEFNEVAARIRVALQSRMQDPRPYFGTLDRIDPVDLELLKHLLGRKQRQRFGQAWGAYEAECVRMTQDPVGQAFYASPNQVRSSLEQVLSFTSLR